MSLDEGNDGHGYVMSPHVAAMLESKEAGEATVRAFIADIFTQRIQSHHAEAMKGKRFAEHLERFIERAPQVIEVIVYTDGVEGFSIQQVQRITDDLVELEDSEFMARYGLEELFAALSEAEAAGELDPESPYQALAKHIDPVNPAAGALTIDRLILSAIRARDSHYNRQRAASFAGSFMVASGLASLGVSALLHAVGSATPFPLPTPPVAIALAILALGLGLTWLSFRWRDKEPDPPLPATISAWLTENNHQNGLRYWHAVYWPTAKRLACERRVFGFSFPKKSPPPKSEWPDLSDAEWDYWEHGPGKPVSARYYEPFMARIQRWHQHASRVLLGCLVLVIGAPLADTAWSLFSHDHIALFASSSFKVGNVLVLILLAFALTHGGLPPLRWLPQVLRRYWFGPLPADAEAYRDYLLGRA